MTMYEKAKFFYSKGNWGDAELTMVVNAGLLTEKEVIQLKKEVEKEQADK